MTAPIIISIAAFLKRREPWLRHATREHLLGFVTWYWRDARVGVVREAGRIVAVALARATSDLARTKADPWYHDEAGRIVWLDHIASRHPSGIAHLRAQARRRFGEREAYAGEVFKRDGELRMLPQKLVERIIAGGT